jgi:hypothetical protein
LEELKDNPRKTAKKNTAGCNSVLLHQGDEAADHGVCYREKLLLEEYPNTASMESLTCILEFSARQCHSFEADHRRSHEVNRIPVRLQKELKAHLNGLVTESHRTETRGDLCT